MTFHPGAVLRRSAQSIRHAPGLERCAPLWNRVRAPYRRLLTRLGATDGIPVTVGGCEIRLAAEAVNLNWETVEVEAYRAFVEQLRTHDIVFDIGAHFGTYTLIALKRGGPATRVVAYEPCELTRDYLSRHLRWNGAGGNVIVRPVCCGSRSGVTPFYQRPGVPEGINGVVPDAGLIATDAPMVTIDDEVADFRLVPTLIKIDVEGAELDVLKGAAGVLATHRPRLLISVHAKRLAALGLDCDAIRTWLGDHHYDWRVVGEDQELHVLSHPV